ncbi:MULTISPECIES: FAD-dependent tricarballylate dehydrogenase TcuA [unclassified Micromonospora]|uniref:FAD-dependent tricarballylate dehydrogenase TcuA n=1 Tax=unclassified Micromonospora TaxID=2617518 RepID=UPI003A8BD114
MSGPIRVIVVGAGNAALCAALSAREHGADVTVMECAPRADRGGNTAFAAGTMRVEITGGAELGTLVDDLPPEQAEQIDNRPYPAEEFYDDLARMSNYQCDPDLTDQVVSRSFDTARWMRAAGVRFVPVLTPPSSAGGAGQGAVNAPLVAVSGGGPGLVDALVLACERAGVRISYETRVEALLRQGGRVTGVRALGPDGDLVLPADSVILASGGFESNAEWRTRYLGAGWDVARVRGTRFNNGDGIRMALAIGASPRGQWSGCHAVPWEANAPEFGELAVGDQFKKCSYPYGIMVNARGERFVDEGADYRDYTYAAYGRAILAQPGLVAWQIFDQRTAPLLRDEYRIRQVTRVRAADLDDLAARMVGVDPAGLLRTVERYNAAVQTEVPFLPHIRDGRGAPGLPVPRSNWANPLDSPPYEAYAVTCGVTFTFGGLRTDGDGRVLDTGHRPIDGLYAAGELVGGLFYHNYPGGSGLTSGAVLGRTAGAAAAVPRGVPQAGKRLGNTIVSGR